MLDFNAPQKKTMILRRVDRYNSQDEESYNESENSCKDKGEDAYPCNGCLLMMRRIFNNQPRLQELT